jgi:CheY-like chemotaxis protein
MQVRLDPNRIEQVIVNLAVHARDAMPDGGELRIAARNVTAALPPVETGAAASAPSTPADSFDHVELTFTDTGRGLSEELRAHLFEPFFARGGPGRGSGLELATVYGIVTQSGGHISVESGPDSGTTFRLLFPISTAAAPATLLSNPVVGGHERVLIVEDDKEVREMLSFSMRAADYEIFAAVDGLDAIELLERTGLQPDILVTDVVMPNLGGHELARHMQQRQPGLRVLYMTGYTDDPELSLGLVHGSFTVLSKPFRPEQLVRAVRALLDAPESPKA